MNSVSSNPPSRIGHSLPPPVQSPAKQCEELKHGPMSEFHKYVPTNKIVSNVNKQYVPHSGKYQTETNEYTLTRPTALNGNNEENALNMKQTFQQDESCNNSSYSLTSPHSQYPGNGDSTYVANYSPPRNGNVGGSNLQTLRKFSNLQSLQNLNLTHMSSDSPRASYSSSSSSTTSSSSSNLIIPEIFKQDSMHHQQPAYPLPPKPRDTQSPPQLIHAQANSYLPYPQPLPHPTNYAQPCYKNNCKSPINIPSNQRSPTDCQNGQVAKPSQNGSTASGIPCGPAQYGYVSPACNPISQPVGFSSSSNSSSFTSYSNSSGYLQPNNSCPSSIQQNVQSRIPIHSTSTADHTNGPDIRRLSDPNSRTTDFPQFNNQKLPNEYPQHVIHSRCAQKR